MKKSLLLLLLLLCPLRAEFLLKPNDVLAICGDSITEQRIYSAYIEDYLLMCRPTPGLRVVQLGWSGEKAPGFLARMETDLFPFKPTVLTTCYGMNDGRYAVMTESTGDDYRQGMDGIVLAAKKNGVRAMVVGSPGAVDPARFHNNEPNAIDAAGYNQTLGALTEIARDVAQAQGAAFADVHTPLLQTMDRAKAALGADYRVGGKDGVHPGPNGHLVMAYAFLKALGCDGAIGTITVDWVGGKAAATEGQNLLSYKDGVLELESTRYPFYAAAGGPDSAAAILPFLPFNDELNRYMLVVRGINEAEATLTWGSQAKVVSSADLARGVNLAVLFPDNPLADRFEKVDALVQLQQVHETFLVKQLLHNYAAYAASVPNASALENARTQAMAQDLAFFNAAQAAVVPVRHTLRIEPVRAHSTP